MNKLGSDSDTWSPTPLRVIDGGGLKFMDSFKPATFKRSFNSAMDLLSAPAKIATTLTGTGAIFNPLINKRLEHKGKISSMLGNRDADGYKNGKRIVQMKELTDTQKKQMEEHRKHHTPSHIRHMTKLMMDGKSFDEAHDLTQKLEGGSLMGDVGKAILSDGNDVGSMNRLKGVASNVLQQGVSGALDVGSNLVKSTFRDGLNKSLYGGNNLL